MKKLFTILLALAMIFAMSATVFAANEGKTDVSIEDGRTYTGHKLLNATVSLKAGDACAQGVAHTPNCYNYSYTVNADYRVILANQANVTTDGKTEQEIDQAIITYLVGLTNATDMRTAADALYNAIKTADPAITGTAVNDEAEIDQGYWLFVDTTVPGNDKVKSPVIVNTAGLLKLEINPKVGLPTVTKEVLEVDDATGASNWQETATYDIGDAVTFRLIATMPDSLADWANYTMVFHDTLSAGLTLNAVSFEVTIGDTVYDSENSPFVYAAGQNGAFTLTCDNVKDIPGITEDSVIVVTYTATLNAGAVIAGAGNSNTVYLAYSNDPYSGSTATTAVDTVTVYTYKVTVNKTDGTAPLAGAEFKLEKLVKDGDGTKYVELAAPTINHDTEFVWTGLDAGTYRLTETKAPAGYNQVGPEEIIITNDNAQRTVVNSTGSVLPETGAEGTFFLITGGTLLVVLAAVFMITRKKMSIYED